MMQGKVKISKKVKKVINTRQNTINVNSLMHFQKCHFKVFIELLTTYKYFTYEAIFAVTVCHRREQTSH